VTTRSTEGELAEATLRLRQGDLYPVQGMFKFRGEEWIELTEVSASPEVVAVPRVDGPAPVIRATAPPASLSPAASVADEIRVLEALHRIGADLGDPIEIARAGAAVEVKGFGIGARRRAQIEQALRGATAVNLSFVEEAAPPGIRGSSPAAVAVRSNPSPLEPYLLERLGGPAGIEQFTNQVFDLDEQIMARAHAVQRLAARFPDMSALGSAEASAYRGMQQDHLRALVQLERNLAAALKPVAASAEPLAASSSSPSAQSLLQAARRLERSLSILLGAAPLDVGDADRLPARLLSEHAELEQLTRILLETMGQ
jgi:hypothetical protein